MEIDLEDEIRDQEIEEFQQNYNFRFQEKQGANIVTHSRNIQNSMRIKESKRKQNRAECEKRKQREKLKKMEQLKRIREIEKQEMQQKINLIQNKSGFQIKAKENKKSLGFQMSSEFDPISYDQTMERIFNQEDDNGVKEKFQDKEDVEEDDDEEEKLAIVDQSDIQQDFQMQNVAQSGIWYMCDKCRRAFREGSYRYVIDQKRNKKSSKASQPQQQFDDYTLCHMCFTNNSHSKKMKKLMIPKICKFNHEQIQKYQKFGKNVEQPLQKQLLEQYQGIEFQDIIGDNIPTRFKYQNVKGDDYGLQNEELLYMQDKNLNSLISLKKLAAYRDDKIDLRKISFQKKKYEKDIKMKKRQLKSMRKQRRKAKEDNQKKRVANRIEFDDFIDKQYGQEDQNKSNTKKSSQIKSQIKSDRLKLYSLKKK